MRSVFYNFGFATISRVAVTIVGVFIVALLTRNLGPQAYGQYSAVLAYAFIGSVLADMGLNTILVREISQKPEKEVEILGSLLTLRAILVFIVISVTIIVAWFLPYEDTVKKGIMLMSFFTFFSSIVQLLLGVFQKYLRLYLVSLADIAMRGVQLGLVVLFIKYEFLTLQNVFIITIISEFIHVAIVYYFTQKIISIKPQIDFDYWKQIIKNAFPIGISLVFTLIYFRIDTIFLSLLRPVEEVGIYSVGYKVLELVIFFPSLYAGLIMPRLSSSAVSDKNDFILIFKKAFNIIILMALPCAAYLYFFSKPIVNLIGGIDFIQAAPVVAVLIPAIFMIFIGNLCGRSLIALDMQKKSMFLYFFGAILNIVTNLIFIPKYGFIAAAWTTVATEAFVTIGMCFLLYKNNVFKINFMPILKRIILTIILSVFFYATKNHFIYATLISPVLFAMLVIFFRIISPQEIRRMLVSQKF